jgi:hypothetical protein
LPLLPFVSTEGRRNVFGYADKKGTAHVAVRVAVKIGLSSVSGFLIKAYFIGRLKEGQGVQFVVFVIDHDEALDARVHMNPLSDFIAPRFFRQIRRRVDERYSVMFCRQKPNEDRIARSKKERSARR